MSAGVASLERCLVALKSCQANEVRWFDAIQVNLSAVLAIME